MSGGSRPSGGGGSSGSATSNRELEQPPPRQDNDNVKKIVIFSKTTALHVHESFLYISLTITARLRRETTANANQRALNCVTLIMEGIKNGL